MRNFKKNENGTSRGIPFLSIAVFFVICFMLSACNDNKLGYNEQRINNSIFEDTNIISENFDESNRIDSIYSYLNEWSDDNNFVIKKDNFGNIFVFRENFLNKNSADSTKILFCRISNHEYFYNLHSLACALNVLKDSNSSNDLRLIVTVDDKEDFSAYSKIPDEKILCDKMIFLSNDPLLPKNNLIVASPGEQQYTMKMSLNFNEPKFQKAYEVTISGLSEGTSEDRTEISHPNPIKALNTLLTTCRSKGILYEIAAFNAGSTQGYYSSYATATVVVNENNENQFIKQFLKLQKKFIDKNSKDHHYLNYSMREIPIPERVISIDSSEKIVSFLYTMINGNFVFDDESEENIANSEMLTASTATGNFIVSARAQSFDEDAFPKFEETFASICHLTDFELIKGSYYPVWNFDAESQSYKDLKEVVKLVTGDYAKTENAFYPQGFAKLKEKNPDIDSAVLNVSKENPALAYEIVSEYFKL